MIGRAYVTLLGRSTWALVNTYYALLVEKWFFPDKIHVFTEKPYEAHLAKARLALEILSNEYGFEPDIQEVVIPSSDFIEAGRQISALVTELKASGFTVAIDITGGRKALVAGTLLSIANLDIDHVLYLSINSLDNAANPYMMIPLRIQQLRDFSEEAKRVQI